MVENSDIMIGIVGGEIAGDELLSAKKIGKKGSIYPADTNHQKAIESAKKKGQDSKRFSRCRPFGFLCPGEERA